MQIKATDELQVIETIEKLDVTPRVLLESSHSTRRIELLGSVLEAQYTIDDNLLVLVTEGNPFEEALYIYYLSSNLKVLDSLELSANYCAGILNDLSIVGSDSITFSFFEKEDKWILSILPSPKYIILDNNYPVKNGSSIFNKKWLRLKRA